MEPIKTKGIVVRSHTAGDYNKMLTVISADLGRINVWAKGAKSRRSGFSLPSEILCYSEFLLNKRDEVYTLSSASTIDCFYGLREDVEKLSCAIYFADVAAVTCGGDETGEALRLLLNCLHFLEKDKLSIKYIKSMYEIRMAAISGFMPCLETCLTCGAEEAAYFDLEAGGVLCGSCKRGNSFHLNEKEYNTLKRFVSPKLAEAFCGAPNLSEDFYFLCEKYLVLHTDINLKTLDYLKSIMSH